MDLDATGSATVAGGTVKQSGKHVTSMRVAFGDFEFVDPEDDVADITGTGLELNALWNGFSLAGDLPASHVEIVVPPAQIHDVSVFNRLIPGDSTLALRSGTGEVEARLEVAERVAAGTLDLVADDIILKTQDVPLRGDLEVHANLAEGDLPSRVFDLSGTRIVLDDVVDEALSAQKQEKLEAWYCDVELQEGQVVFAKPLAASGQVWLRMYDTRPIVAMLKEFGDPPKWFSLMPTVKDIDGTMGVGFSKDRIAVDDVVLTGKKLEVLGWLHFFDKKASGRLYLKHGILAAGIALDQNKARVHLSKPRKWFEERQASPPDSDEPPATK